MKHNLVADGYSYRIRPITYEDAQFIIDVRLEDKERNCFIHEISSDVNIQYQWLDKYFERDDDYYFVIENKLLGEREGLIAIYDVKENKAEWGRWVIKKGSLSAIESVDLIFKVAFEKLGLEELYCRTIEDNITVVSFHETVGLKKRGILNEFFELHGKRANAVEHYINRELYFSQIQSELEDKSCLIFRRNIKQLLGKFDFHHIGVATSNIEKEFMSYKFLGYKKEGTTFEDPNQGIKGLFIVANNQPRLELLADINGSNTVSPFLSKGTKMYHFAYIVSNIETAVEILVKCRAKVISPLKKSTYFGKRICFLLLPNMFMIELVEA